MSDFPSCRAGPCGTFRLPFGIALAQLPEKTCNANNTLVLTTSSMDHRNEGAGDGAVSLGLTSVYNLCCEFGSPSHDYLSQIAPILRLFQWDRSYNSDLQVTTVQPEDSSSFSTWFHVHWLGLMLRLPFSSYRLRSYAVLRVYCLRSQLTPSPI